MFGCHAWYPWRNWAWFPFLGRRRRGQSVEAKRPQKTTDQEKEAAMNVLHNDEPQLEQKPNVPLLSVVETEEKKTKAIISSIPGTPEDPLPSVAPSWPASVSGTTTGPVSVRHCPESSVHSRRADESLTTCSMQPGVSSLSREGSCRDDDGGQVVFDADLEREGENASTSADIVACDDGKSIEVTAFIGDGEVEEVNAKTAPIPIHEPNAIGSAFTSRSSSTVSDDDDLLQASANTVIAAPIRDYASPGAALILPSSALTPVAADSTAQSILPVAAVIGDQNRSLPFSHLLLHQLSDSESVGSGESDLVVSAVPDSFQRQTSGGSNSASAMPFFRTPLMIAGGPGLGSNSTSTTRASNYAVHGQHPLLNQQGASTSSAAVRALSHTALAGFEDDLASASRSTVVAYDFPSPHPYYSAKHLHTEQVVSKHTLKGKLNKFQRLLDKAFALINMGTEESIIEGCGIVAKVMVNAWVAPKIGHDLAYGLCDYLREMTYFDLLLHFLLNPETKQRVRLAAGRALEECLSAPNRDYIASPASSETGGTSHRLERFVQVIKSFKESEELRVAVSLLESLFKQSAHTNSHLIELSALDFVLNACKATTNPHTLRHAALALANLSMYSDSECQQRMIAKNVPDWLFLLASSQDDVTRYYACLAICVLVSNKEIETAVTKSGTLSLVEPFLLAHKPADFATSDYKHCQGRPMQWLAKLVPVLHAKRRESRAMAAFHFAMEAGIKKDQEALGVFEQIGAVEALKQVAALPEEVAPKYASLALEIIGEEVPYKLSHQVPLWSVEDVQYWVTHIGFEKYAQSFYEQKVDGDLLLLISDTELAGDVGMKSGLLRKRFMRELESLKMAADYSCVDETQLDRFLVSVNPLFSVYTYRLLEMGVDRSIMPSLTDEMMKSECGISNPVHRAQLLQSVQECKHIDDMEVALLSKHIDIFISYRRSTGNQLASLIKVLLQLRGYKVFIDVDRLYAGKFDSSLLKNIQAAKHFVLVLTPHALDRCVDDDDCSDWVHKEVLCALEHNKNIIPVFDPAFEWPDNQLLPSDIRGVTRFNGVRWVHEYQEACVDKLEKFIEGEVNIDRGYNASPQRGQQPQQQHGANYRSSSKTNSFSNGNQQYGNVPDAADLILEALSAASRGRASSHDQLLSQ